MEIAKISEKFKSHIQVWKHTINKYDIEDLRRKPNDSAWSLGQACLHVVILHEIFYMKNAWTCINIDKEAFQTPEGKNFMGRMIFFFKSIPPMKIKMPKGHAFDPPQPESKEELLQKLDEIVAMMKAVEEKLPNADLSIKSKHPLLGMMNAFEWFQAAEFHIRHHFLQKKRIEKFLQQA